MTRLRYDGLATGSAGALTALTLGGSLTNSATSITFSAALKSDNGTAVPTITGSDYIPLSILDTDGNLAEIVYLTAYTSGATTGTISRGKEGTTGVAHASGMGVVHGPTASDMPGVGGGIIGFCQYAPATGIAKSTTTTTSADVDATNLVVTFTAPPSGNVLVTLGGYANVTATTTQFFWGLRSGSSDVTGSYMGVMSTVAHSTFASASVVMAVTPGTSYTWKWAFYRLVTGTGNIFVGADGNGGTAPATMIVHALP
jgi:hypothetical protein